MNRKACTGFTLIETLAALVVMSVGLLGVAALHTLSIGTGRTAYYRVQAVNLTSDMAERIRGNPLALDAYTGPGAAHDCAPTAESESVECTPEQLAAHDLHLWERSLRTSLPNGEWRIQIDAGALPPRYRIEVSWDEIGQGRVQYQIDIRVALK